MILVSNMSYMAAITLLEAFKRKENRQSLSEGGRSVRIRAIPAPK